MAKRRKKSPSRRRRRRSGMSGVSVKGGSNALITTAMRIAGAIGAGYLTNHLLPASMNDKVKALIPFGAGIAGIMFSKDGMVRNISEGLAVGGGYNTVRTLMPGIAGITDADINGIEDEITIGEDNINEDPTMIGANDSYSIGEVNETVNGEEMY